MNRIKFDDVIGRRRREQLTHIHSSIESLYPRLDTLMVGLGQVMLAAGCPEYFSVIAQASDTYIAAEISWTHSTKWLLQSQWVPSSIELAPLTSEEFHAIVDAASWANLPTWDEEIDLEKRRSWLTDQGGICCYCFTDGTWRSVNPDTTINLVREFDGEKLRVGFALQMITTVAIRRSKLQNHADPD